MSESILAATLITDIHTGITATTIIVAVPIDTGTIVGDVGTTIRISKRSREIREFKNSASPNCRNFDLPECENTSNLDDHSK